MMLFVYTKTNNNNIINLDRYQFPLASIDGNFREADDALVGYLNDNVVPRNIFVRNKSFDLQQLTFCNTGVSSELKRTTPSFSKNT